MQGKSGKINAIQPMCNVKRH